MLDKHRRDSTNLLDCFARPKDDFGITAAATAVEIHRRGQFGVGDVPARRRDLLLEISRRNLAGDESLSKRDQLWRIHAFSLVGRWPTRKMPISTSASEDGSGT